MRGDRTTHRFPTSLRLTAACLLLVAVTSNTGCRDAPPPLPPGGAETPSASTTPAIRFDDVTEQSGLEHVITSGYEAEQFGMIDFVGGGVAAFDYDLDGAIDLAMAGGGYYEGEELRGRPGALYRGLAAFRFAEATAAAGYDLSEHFNHAIVCDDFDADGFDDLLVTGFGGLQLLMNQGDGTFAERDASSGLVDELWSTGTATLDLNGDSLIDVYAAHYGDWSPQNNPICHLDLPGNPRGACAPKQFAGVGDKLFIASSDGTYEERGGALGVEPAGRGLAVLAADFDGDKDTDLYVANDSDRNFYYENQNGTLRESATLKGCAVDNAGVMQGSMGVAVGDYQNDSQADLFVTNFSKELPALYEGRGVLGYRFATIPSGLRILGEEQVSWGTLFVDVDNDADQDLVVVSGHVDRVNPNHLQKSSMLENLGRKFADRSEVVGEFFRTPVAGRGLASADFDADGLIDFAITQLDAPSVVLRNASQPKQDWLQLRLVGTASNRNAVGATAVLRGPSGVQNGWVFSGGSYLSSSQRLLHFAVPSDAKGKPLVLHIRWPSGLEEDLEISAAGRRLLVIESPDGSAASQVVGL